VRLVYRGATEPVRSSFSFGFSGLLHGCVLAWVILGGTRDRALSIYDREIRPNEKKIIWYNLREKLPEIAPGDEKDEGRPARARVEAPQTMVAGARDDAHPAALIWAPEPEVAAPKETPLPNVVAVAPPKIVRPFVSPPVQAPAEVKAAALPDAPRVAAAEVKAALPLPETVSGGPRRKFTVPEKAPAEVKTAALPDAPRVAAAEVKAAVLLPETVPGGPRRKFTVPQKAPAEVKTAALPDAPRVAAAEVKAALPLTQAVPGGPRREFTAPVKAPAEVKAAALPAAPEAAAGARKRSLTVAGLIGRVPSMPDATPPIPAEPAAAPSVPGAAGGATLAIVGLNPARTTEVPKPPASRAAGFSAGPEPRAEGDTGARGSALVNVPGLVVRGGAKDTEPTLMAPFSPTSRENLLAAARVARDAAPGVPPEDRSRAAVPDPRFAGRVVYTMAVQMPNVTSFSGSWLVWFAERAPGTAGRRIQPPEVVRKVDPKYVAAAVAERVEGAVRLFGVIGKNGRVDGILFLRQLDQRLDQSAREALAKWEFTPAMRDGVAVDVDAIFEIPFHLAPRPKL
jgi:TonB family protein